MMQLCNKPHITAAQITAIIVIILTAAIMSFPKNCKAETEKPAYVITLSPQARIEWQEALTNKKWHKKTVSTDRYNRKKLLLYDKTNKIYWQEYAIKSGSAILYIEEEIDKKLASTLKKAEKHAITNRLNIWQKKNIITPKEITSEHIGKFSIVEATATDVANIKGNIFINFGKNWRTDFTAYIPKRNANRVVSYLQYKNIRNINELKGKKLQIRGFIYEKNGKAITIHSPYQIEIRPE